MAMYEKSKRGPVHDISLKDVDLINNSGSESPELQRCVNISMSNIKQYVDYFLNALTSSWLLIVCNPCIYPSSKDENDVRDPYDLNLISEGNLPEERESTRIGSFKVDNYNSY